MKNFLQLTGLMMSAVMCLFASCSGDSDDEKDIKGVPTVTVEVYLSAETLEWTDGSFVVTYLPSGKTEEIKANATVFAHDPNPETDAAFLNPFTSKNIKKATLKTTCGRDETQITLKPNLKVKQGTVTTDDAKYDYEVNGVIKYQTSPTSGKTGHNFDRQRGIKGSALESFVSRNTVTLVSIDL